MIYIVTGLMRTGTSLMMQVLREAGIPPHFSKAYERRGKGGRLRNVCFLETQQSIRGDISAVPDGSCVKVFLNMMHKIALDPEKHKVIAMWRPTVDRLRSTRSGLPPAAWENYQKKCTHANTEVESCYSDLLKQFPSRLIVNFNDLIDSPEVVLSSVVDYIELPQTDGMLAVINPKNRHYKSE